MAYRDTHASFPKPQGQFIVFQIRTADSMPLVQKQRSQCPHADAADTDQMIMFAQSPSVTKANCKAASV